MLKVILGYIADLGSSKMKTKIKINGKKEMKMYTYIYLSLYMYVYTQFCNKLFKIVKTTLCRLNVKILNIHSLSYNHLFIIVIT